MVKWTTPNHVLFRITKLTYHHGSEVHQKSDLNCRIYQDWSEEYNLPSRQREARKSSEHGPENGKRKFNQTRRRSDNGRSARVDCHIYRKRNKYRQSRCYTFSAFAWTFHFFQFFHQRGKRCNLFSFSSKGFGNLKKDVKRKTACKFREISLLSLR